MQFYIYSLLRLLKIPEILLSNFELVSHILCTTHLPKLQYVWPAGSVDEDANQQGIAHMVEHVTFLGSSKRDHLLGTGARSNAYTDFHHTVFHVHSPLSNLATRDPVPMLDQVQPTP